MTCDSSYQQLTTFQVAARANPTPISYPEAIRVCRASNVVACPLSFIIHVLRPLECRVPSLANEH